MKKCLAIVLTVLLSISLFGCSELKETRNVFDEIWNLMVLERYSVKQTVLTSSTKDAYVDYDLGEFESIVIPHFNLNISWWSSGDGERELCFFYRIGDGEYAIFLYNYKSKTLYGDTDFSYLIDNFLTDYFEWCNDDTRYCIDNLGDYTFEYANPIYNR